jgi:hypothetical protein
MTTWSLSRLMDLSDKNSEGDRLSPSELREKFPEHKDLFTYELTQEAAQAVVDENLARQDLQGEIEKGPKSGAFGVANFVAAMIPHAIDPIDITVGLGVGGVIRGAMAARKLAIASRAGRAGLAVGEAAVGNILVEPVTAITSNVEGRDYGMTEAFVNSVGGAVLGVGITKGIPAAVRRVMKRGAGATEVNVKTSIAQLDSGRMADASTVTKDIINETAPTAKEFQRIDPTSITEGKVYGAVVRKSDKGSINIGDDLGDGITYLSFDRGSANGAAGSKYADRVATISEFDINNKLNLIDMDATAPKEFIEITSRYVEDVDIIIDEPNLTPRQVLDKIREAVDNNEIESDTLRQIGRDLSEETEFDGYYHDNRVELGEAAPQNNILALFNRDKLSQLSADKPDLDTVSRASDKDLQEISKIESGKEDHPFTQYESDLSADSRALIDSELLDLDVSKIDANFEAAVKDASELAEIGLIDKTTIDRINESGTDLKTTIDAISKAVNCFIGAIT